MRTPVGFIRTCAIVQTLNTHYLLVGPAELAADPVRAGGVPKNGLKADQWLTPKGEKSTEAHASRSQPRTA